jgi:hypothetical protein
MSEVLVSLNPARLIAALLLIVALIGVYRGFATCLQNLAYTRAQTELSFWGRDTYQPTRQAIQTTAGTLQALLHAAPGHPEYLELQAHYLRWQAYWSDDLQSRDALGREAVEVQHQALLYRPAHRQGWSKMVEYASTASSGKVMLELAQTRLDSLRPPGNRHGPMGRSEVVH